MKIVKPKFAGERNMYPNYGSAYVGFSYRSSNPVSAGIAYFTRGEYKGIVPSHSFIVINKTTIIEATLPEVRLHPIQEYFDDPNLIVFFRRPVGLSAIDTEDIIFTATLHLGKKYDASLFGYFLIRSLLRKLGIFEPFKAKPALLDSPDQWICSELCSYCLQKIPRYRDYYPLSSYHSSKIDPLMLFRSEVFEPMVFVGED